MNHSITERRIEAVVFDMDGLMFNTEDIYDRVGSTLLARRGKTFTIELKRLMMGRQNREALQIMIDHCRLGDAAESLAAESNELFLDMLPKQIAMMPGLAELLDWLERNRLPKAVATSSSRILAEAALGFFDLIPRFEFVLTGDDVSKGKPDPEIYLSSAQRLQIETGRMMVLEDSVNGTRAAVAAGALTIAIPGSHHDPAEFSHVPYVAESLKSPVVWALLEETNLRH